MQIRYKYKNKAGFSLTELLVAVLILSMVSAVVAGGIPVARDAYTKVTVTANAQVLLSTTISALRSEIGPSKIDASDITTKDSIIYLSGKNESKSRIYIAGDVITIQEFVEYTDSSSPYYNSTITIDPRPLTVGTDELYATYSEISYSSSDNTDMVSVKGLTVKRKGDNKEYVDPVDLSIRVIGN